MKICIVSHEFEPFPGGGIATYHNAAANVLARRGHEVHVVTNAALYGSELVRHRAERWQHGNLTVHRLPLFDESRKPLPGTDMFGVPLPPAGERVGSWALDVSNLAALGVASYLRALHDEVGLDIVESPEFFAETYYLIRARASGRRREFPPVCVHAHTSSRVAFGTNRHLWELGYHPHRQLMLREEYVLRHADGLLSPSRSLLQRYELAHGDALPAHRAVIPYFVELPERVDDAELPSQLADGGPFLLCVGRIEPRKGADVALRAFATLARRHPQLRLVFLGREAWHHGGSFDEVLESCVPAEFADRVVRLGNVPRTQVLASMRRAVAFLHPVPWDNYPCATLEAMSMGAVCVVSDSGGQAEMVEDGSSGLIHRSGDVDDLVRCVSQVLDQDALAQELARNAVERARRVTDEHELAQQRATFFEQIVEHAATRVQSAASPSEPRRAVVVVDAAGGSVECFQRTRDALLADGGEPTSVFVLQRPEGAALPDGWLELASSDRMPWLDEAEDVEVVWLMAGVALAPGSLDELRQLAGSAGGAGAFPWLQVAEPLPFPFGPDLSIDDLLFEGRSLPPAFVSTAGVLQPCASLAALGDPVSRLAALLAVAGSTAKGPLLHTAGVVGRYSRRLPVATADVLRRVLGMLDVLGRVPRTKTLLGAVADAAAHPSANSAVPSGGVRLLPEWPRDELRADRAPVQFEIGIRRLAQLDGLAVPADATIGIELDCDNWFDVLHLVEAAGGLGARIVLALADGDAALSRAGIAELVCAYQCIRDWWRELGDGSGAGNLAGDAYLRLCGQLRELLRWRASKVRDGTSDGDAVLALPPVAHALLARDETAMRFWRPFLAASEGRAFDDYVDALCRREDLRDLVRRHVWVRVLLQECLWRRWNAPAHAVLDELYRDPDARARLWREELDACRAANLDWWLSSVREALGLERVHDDAGNFVWSQLQDDREAATSAHVTVLVPALSDDVDVGPAVRSALAQRAVELRVIVIVAGDAAAPAATVREIGDERVALHVCRTAWDTGGAFEEALAAVESDYVALLRPEDRFHPDRLATCCELLDRDDGVSVVASAVCFFGSGDRAIDAATVSVFADGRETRDWLVRHEHGLRRDATIAEPLRRLLRHDHLVGDSNIVCRRTWLRDRAQMLREGDGVRHQSVFLGAAADGELRIVRHPLLALGLDPARRLGVASVAGGGARLARVVSRIVERRLANLLPAGAEDADNLRELLDDVACNPEWNLAHLFVTSAARQASQLRDRDAPGAGAAVLEGLFARLDGEAEGERRRVAARRSERAQEILRRVLADEVHVLRSRLEWQQRRGDEAGEQLGAARARLERIEAAHREQECRLRAELQRLQAALDAQHEAQQELQRSFERQRTAHEVQRDADRRTLRHVNDVGVRTRAALGAQLAAHDVERGSDLVLGGTRIRPGTSSRRALTKVRHLLHRFADLFRRRRGGRRAPLMVVCQDDSGWRREQALALMAGRDLHEVRLLPIHEARSAQPHGVSVYYYAPTRAGEAARLADRTHVDHEAWSAVAAGLTRQLEDGTNETAALVRLAAVAKSHGARALVFAGGARWCAQLSQAAELAGLPWSAVVDSVPAGVSKAQPALVERLGGARVLVARSSGIANELAAGGIDRAAVDVVFPLPAPGVFDAAADGAGWSLAYGRLRDAEVWDETINGWVLAAPPSARLRVIATVDREDLGSLACAHVVRCLAARWPSRISVEIVSDTSHDLVAHLDGPAPDCLVWVCSDLDELHAPAPVVLAAMRAGVPIAAWQTPTAEDLFGSLNAVRWIAPWSSVDVVAETMRSLLAAGTGRAFETSLLTARVDELSASDAGVAAIRRRIDALLGNG